MLIAALILAATVDPVLAHYEATESRQLVPMLSEVIQFPTEKGNAEAFDHQKAWLLKTAKDLGFQSRDAGKITEIELPGPAGAPVLGLLVHGDVAAVDPDPWSVGPFGGKVENGFVTGRGSADDKGPLVQALLAMKALAESGVPRTHTIRLLVGSEEETEAAEIGEYLRNHAAPDYSLVLDAQFPVVVGEKAWDALAIVTPIAERGPNTKPYTVAEIDAGLSPSIVPDRAEVKLKWIGETPAWTEVEKDLKSFPMPEGTPFVTGANGEILRVLTYGKPAHSGMNLSRGRNALVALARALEGKLPNGGANDLMAFIRMAGKDLYGTGLGLTRDDPVWGRYGVNIATIKPVDGDRSKVVLTINFRRTPPRTGTQAKAYLVDAVKKFNARTGASLAVDDKLSYFEDEPLTIDPKAKIVRRLLADYERATGAPAKPAVVGGGTYAKRMPNSIAFGMWFPDQPYPGHDVDEKISIADLHRGTRVLIHALTDIATGAKMVKPFGR